MRRPMRADNLGSGEEVSDIGGDGVFETARLACQKFELLLQRLKRNAEILRLGLTRGRADVAPWIEAEALRLDLLEARCGFRRSRPPFPISSRPPVPI